MQASLALAARAAAELERRRRDPECDLGRARSGLLPFTQYTKPTYITGSHHRVIAEHIDRLLAGRFGRLLICMPPRHGKSELVSRRLPAYFFGRWPDRHVISTSYGEPLPSVFSRDVQRIVNGERYRRVFPKVQLKDSVSDLFNATGYVGAKSKNLQRANYWEVLGHGGTYRAAGVGGGITGLGAHLGIIDDPVKSMEQARSKAYLDRCEDWFHGDFLTRLEKDAPVILTMTRWATDDLAGRILASEDAKSWKVLAFPAVMDRPKSTHDKREQGAALWPWKMDRRALLRIKNVVTRKKGARVWQGLYQQRPTPPDGEVVKRSQIQYYREPPSSFTRIVQSWDLNFKETGVSMVCGQVWGATAADAYLLDEYRERVGFSATLRAILAMRKRWPATGAIYVEDKANGPAVIDVLKKRVPGMIAVSPWGSKFERISSVAYLFEAGNVHVPDPAICEWAAEWVDEIIVHPNGEFTDRGDAAAQALSRLFGTDNVIVGPGEGLEQISGWNL